MKLTRKRNEAGWACVKFNDLYGQECSLQKSSLARADAVWIGVMWGLAFPPGSECEALYEKTEKKLAGHQWLKNTSARMHITRPMAKKLIKELQCFVDTGEVRVK